MIRIGLYSEDRTLHPLLSSALGKEFNVLLESDGSQNSSWQSPFGVPAWTAVSRMPSPSMPCCATSFEKCSCAESESVIM